ALGLRHPNLVIGTLTLDEAAPQSGDTLRVSWEVENTGAGPARLDWSDGIWLSRDEALDPQDIFLGEVGQTAPLADGASAAAFADVTLPISVSGAWFILVSADRENAVSEPGNEEDNSAAVALDVTLAPYADLEVTEVTAPNLTVDDPGFVTVGWTVANTGTGRGITDGWTDRIIISLDDEIGNNDDIELAAFDHSGGLDKDGTYQREESFYLPAALNGRFKLYVVTDADDAVFENGQEADNRLALDGFF
ncbi:CARDB domain-containing protein, partial [Cribrihabitans sp. XS_ASV171]